MPYRGSCRKAPWWCNNQSSPLKGADVIPTAHHHPAATIFDLPAHLAAKAAPELIAADQRHLASIQAAIEQQTAEVHRQLETLRKQARGSGEYALERDANIHRLSSRLRLLERFGMDLTLGRMNYSTETTAHNASIYVGRMGLTDATGNRLLVDWRSPAAEPFFAATHANPMELTSRRRYRWNRGRITDYWDEIFTTDGFEGHAALDEQSAFIASLGAHRSHRMQDVLGTIQADQDTIIRAPARGALVVDGGPGTGKTVVALHRTAHLLYAEPRLQNRRNGVLFVGPHEPYLAYVSDVLPSLGEDGVQTTTLAGLMAEGTGAPTEGNPVVSELKAGMELVAAIEPAVRLYEQPPAQDVLVETPWDDVWLTTEDWDEAFRTPGSNASHNESRDEIWETLIEIALDKLSMSVDEHDASSDQLRRSLTTHRELREIFVKHWPMLHAEDIVGDLYTVPAYLRMCAPNLTDEQVHALQRATPKAWTQSDLPILDAARRRIGDPQVSKRRRERERILATQRATMARVIDDMVAADDSDLQLMSTLNSEDIREKLDDEDALPSLKSDPLAGPYEHIVVDEAQDLTDAQWQMLLARCPSRSFTIVGDRAQARRGFTESWQDRLERVGLGSVELAHLTINYRTPEPIMVEAESVIRRVMPNANVPTSIRVSDVPVRNGSVTELDEIINTWLANNDHGEGVAAVIGINIPIGIPGSPRVQVLTPQLAKGLEFDLVILIDPEGFGVGVERAVDRYVAMTRATQQLVILNS